MSFTNLELSEALENYANELELSSENPYRIRAYRRAADSIKRCQENINMLVLQGNDLTHLPHVGKNISALISKMIHEKDITLTVKHKKVEFIPDKTILKKRKKVYFKIYLLMPLIEKMIDQLKSLPEVQQIEVAGDYRRRKEIVGDIVILMVTNQANSVFKIFQQQFYVKYIIEETNDQTIVQLKLGILVTLKKVSHDHFGGYLLEYTGNESHYSTLQKLAEESHVNLQGPDESSIYRKLHLPFIPPELRENSGEILAATKHKLPHLIELSDIKGDLHCHTNETDGVYSLEEMVTAAQAKGYQYLAITDHSQSLKITNGMNEYRLLKQIEQINALNAKLNNFTILKSMEVDILENGQLDLSNDVLKELDLTVCSIHSKFKLDCKKQTTRILKAMDNPYFNILGHATGRLIQHRSPYQIDIEGILMAAKEKNCFIEVNSQPARLDINDIYCKQAKDIGVKVAISSDAHTTKGFSFMVLGVNQARRGWLEAKDVVNTYELKALLRLLKK